ncbi:hypothetical protein SM124_16545 [Bacillus sp. 31A1R]|uniref:Uncharacterized protein n=1 Tax=Robertmurraya mangrovi TaxID=3098077 RepID=A0ABU5J1N0_9BACI|nr:hypothetical protein [Bacillus sp. 31A1R]
MNKFKDFQYKENDIYSSCGFNIKNETNARKKKFEHQHQIHSKDPLLT